MRIQFFGAVRTTTGSMHLLEVNGSRILLDCGLFQGRRKEAFIRNRNLPFHPGSIHACVLSHAHIDHSGNLPTLVKNGFRGQIFATPATSDLCDIMLEDSAHIQVNDVRYVNKKRRRQNKKLFEPLYTLEDAERALGRFRAVPYGESAELVPGVKLMFHDAGHLLGSAFTALDITENGSTHRLLYTGDIGRSDMPILRDPAPVRDIDLLITESTYGNRLHPARQDVKAKLADLCKQIKRDGGKLIIPAFSVGRTQQVVYILNELCSEGIIEPIPVYVDSPLSTKATDVYEAHPECYDAEAATFLHSGDEPFAFRKLTYITDVEQSKKLNRARGPMIIISSSGMCTAGRILHHLGNNLEDRHSAVLIVGFQAQHTLGRRLVEGVSPVRIFGEEVSVRAKVHSISALSAHADKDEMLLYLRDMAPGVERAFVVHGEEEASEAFGSSLRELGMGDVLVPEQGEIVDV